MYFRHANINVLLYSGAFAISSCGFAYSIVPFYKLICQSTGITGSPKIITNLSKENLQPIVGTAPITVRFIANVGKNMPWTFKPLQNHTRVVPGQTALTFYSATNNMDRETTGFATYNIIPAKAAPYFNKIQCFCFEKQRLSSKEQVDMPVFFYIDPEFAIDPLLEGVNEIILSYTFFESRD